MLSLVSSLYLRPSTSSLSSLLRQSNTIESICKSRSVQYRLSSFIMSSSSSSSSSSSTTKSLSVDSTTNDMKRKVTSTPLKKQAVLTVYVDTDIRIHLNMKNSDRKARILLPQDFGSKVSLTSLKSFIEKRLMSLHKQPYVLRYQLDGHMNTPKQFNTEEEVASVVQSAIKDSIHLQLYVESLPGIFPPPSADYLCNMADPAESDAYTLLSFYRFNDIEDPEDMKNRLMALWKPFRAVGRVYVAKEGVNAQMAVPSNVLSNFKAACETLPLFQGLYLNTDHLMTRQDFEESQPFKNLHVRVREQIVADGFKESLDWEKAGKEMPPMKWHEELNNPNNIVLDCRNSYESDVGIFDGAIPLNTTFFRESWDALDEILKDKPKDTPIMTYCTGGIRCVKINAYLEQKLGFNNVHRLQGGIISYARELQSQMDSDSASDSDSDNFDGVELINPTKLEPSLHLNRNVMESKFKGMNYVFDERMGARITTDLLSSCETCGSGCDLFKNCENVQCHIRFIQCDKCKDYYNGCCSKACQHEYASFLEREEEQALNMKPNRAMTPRKIKRSISEPISLDTNDITEEVEKVNSIKINTKNEETQTLLEHASDVDSHLDALSTYCERYSVDEPVLLAELRKETAVVQKYAARMVSSHLQGRLFATLSATTKAKNILELGTFTGYSALCFAEGLQNDGKVITCEIDQLSASLAQKYFDLSEHGKKIELKIMKANDLLDSLRQNDNDILFDIVFIDADKKIYLDYLNNLIGDKGGRPLLSKDALIIVDNTLWKGLVLEYEDDLKEHAPDAKLYGNQDRMRLLAKEMHTFNEAVARNPKLASTIIPLRDGLTIIRYNP